MPTSPVVATVVGASFSVNTTTAQLDSVLSIRDFVVLENGTLTVNPNSYSKTTATTLTYAGPTLVSTTLEIRRSTPRPQRTIVLPNTKVSASSWNLEFDRRVRIQEEIDLYGAGGGFSVRLPNDTAYGVSWASDSLFPPTRRVVYNQIETLAPRISPTFTGVPLAPTAVNGTNTTQVATTAFVTSANILLAPIASPVFTGNPTVTTQLFSDDSTRVANTAHVKLVLANSPAITSPTLAGGTLTGVTLAGVSTVGGTSLTSSVPSTFNGTLTAGSTSTFTGASTFNGTATFNGTTTVPTAALGNVSLQAANTTAVARSCRPVVIVSRTTALALAAAVPTDMVFNNVIRDSSGTYNTTTGVFTAPYTGIYRVAAACGVPAFATSSTNFVTMWNNVTNVDILRVNTVFQTTGINVYGIGSALTFLTAGDTRKLVVSSGHAASTFAEGSTTSQTLAFMTIEYLGIDT